MADVLPKLQNLRTINFGDCLVRPDGARAIAKAITDSHQNLKVMKILCMYELKILWITRFVHLLM